jgi:hypothetical protein
MKRAFILLALLATPAQARDMDHGAKGMTPIYGDCISACTMRFGSPHYCIMPDVVGWFHPATKGVLGNGWEDDEHTNPWKNVSAYGTAVMEMYLPKKLVAYAEAHKFWDHQEMHSLNYAQLVQLGVRPCKGTQ